MYELSLAAERAFRKPFRREKIRPDMLLFSEARWPVFAGIGQIGLVLEIARFRADNLLAAAAEPIDFDPIGKFSPRNNFVKATKGLWAPQSTAEQNLAARRLWNKLDVASRSKKRPPQTAIVETYNQAVGFHNKTFDSISILNTAFSPEDIALPSAGSIRRNLPVQIEMTKYLMDREAVQTGKRLVPNREPYSLSQIHWLECLYWASDEMVAKTWYYTRDARLKELAFWDRATEKAKQHPAIKAVLSNRKTNIKAKKLRLTAAA
ncbi:hypothetical protein A3F65_03195 [Candidatus Saccharibacteria bacterium RIFCSPHIGHO2_12_FULL_47_16b]|nr:MAG: hypothetical protein A3F65_03195 [Candidatus Saccharibacteria bacterium RIFCSPHIGHO2_12_FULL_47_16b]